MRHYWSWERRSRSRGNIREVVKTSAEKHIQRIRWNSRDNAWLMEETLVAKQRRISMRKAGGRQDECRPLDGEYARRARYDKKEFIKGKCRDMERK